MKAIIAKLPCRLTGVISGYIGFAGKLLKACQSICTQIQSLQYVMYITGSFNAYFKSVCKWDSSTSRTTQPVALQVVTHKIMDGM